MAKMKKSLSSVIVLLIIMVATSINSGLFSNDNKDNYNLKDEKFYELSQKENLLSVNFVDVGQGDCTVILLPDGKTIMIDAGENGHEEEVFEFLDRNGIKKIDYLVATHPHSDHIGGLYEVVCEYEIGEVYMPKTYHSTNTYLDLLEAIDEKNLVINTALVGKTIIDSDNLKAYFISPYNLYYDNLNNYSAVLRLEYFDNSFLFCADIEKEIEEALLGDGADVDCDVLKVAHHGSSTSSTVKFLKEASPEISVISCGKNNDYGHPHNESLQTITNNSGTVLRTDEMGNVRIITDGYDIAYDVEIDG